LEHIRAQAEERLEELVGDQAVRVLGKARVLTLGGPRKLWRLLSVVPDAQQIGFVRGAGFEYSAETHRVFGRIPLLRSPHTTASRQIADLAHAELAKGDVDTDAAAVKTVVTSRPDLYRQHREELDAPPRTPQELERFQEAYRTVAIWDAAETAALADAILTRGDVPERNALLQELDRHLQGLLRGEEHSLRVSQYRRQIKGRQTGQSNKGKRRAFRQLVERVYAHLQKSSPGRISSGEVLKILTGDIEDFVLADPALPIDFSERVTVDKDWIRWWEVSEVEEGQPFSSWLASEEEEKKGHPVTRKEKTIARQTFLNLLSEIRRSAK
jgi:hypothetical protein